MVPSRVDEVDAAWLAGVLGRPAAAVSVEVLADGVGLLAEVARARIDDGAAPASVIVKTPSSDPSTRDITEHFGYLRREAGTYRALLPRPGVAAPRVFAVVDGPAGPVLVLEDLGLLRPGDQVAGASRADALAAAATAARLHAAFWDDPTLVDHRWLPGPLDEAVAGYDRLFAWTWPGVAASLEGRVPPGHLAAAEAAMAYFGALCAATAAGPLTLVHGDFRLDNLLFDDGDASGVPRAVAIDWQLATRHNGAYDLAFFAAGSLTTDLRRAVEDDLVEHYWSTLVAAGVEGYPLAQCRRDYRRGLVLNLPNPVTALAAVAPRGERGATLLDANVVRALAAVADLGPVDGLVSSR
jgi:hypothetical protein